MPIVRAMLGFITRRTTGRSALASKFRWASQLAKAKTIRAISAQIMARLNSSGVMLSPSAYIGGAPLMS